MQNLNLNVQYNSLDNLPIKIHNEMARTLARFSEPEYAKLFLISLGKLLESNDNIAHINKVELFDKLNITDEQRYTRFFKMLKEMRKRTEYDIVIDEDNEISGNIISRIERNKSNYNVVFDDKMAPILKELKGHYTMYYINSILTFNSSFSISLYNYLMSWEDKKEVINKRYLSTKQLKELFGLSESDYMRKDGTFDRSNFEKKTIHKAVEEIVKSGAINIYWYKAKHRLTKQVVAYVFEYVVFDNYEKVVPGYEFTKGHYGKKEDIIINTEEDIIKKP